MKTLNERCPFSTPVTRLSILYIARDVVKSMRYLGTRAIFNTHMHDLARNLDEVNTTVKGDSKIESLVTLVVARLSLSKSRL